MSKYWKANKETSKKIADLYAAWKKIVDRATELSASLGGSNKGVLTSRGLGSMYVVGFIFDDDSKVDKKQFVRLKNSSNGWRPRRNKSESSKEFYEMRSYLLDDIANLIGMKPWQGTAFHSPGVMFHRGTAYVSTPDYVKKAKGCVRISDLQYEKVGGETDDD